MTRNDQTARQRATRWGGRAGISPRRRAADHVERFFDKLLRPWLVVGIVGMSAVAWDAHAAGRSIASTAPYGVLWLAGTYVLAARSLGPWWRAKIVIGLLVVVGALGLVRVPTSPGGVAFCSAAILVSAIVFGSRGLVTAAVLTGSIFVLAAIGAVSGALRAVQVVSMDPSSPSTWLRVGAVSLFPLAAVAVGIIAILHSYREALSEAGASGTRYRTLFESSGDGVLILKEGCFVECNAAALALFGYEAAELVGKSPVDVSPERQPGGSPSEAKAEERMVAALRGVPQRFPWRHRRRDGTEFDVEVSLTRLALEGELCLLAIVRDVSDRIRAEEALQESEERYRSVVETTGEWIWELDLAGRHTYSNPVSEEILGYGEAELVGKDCFALIHPEDRALARELVATALATGRGWRGRLLRWRHKRGHYRTLESNAILARDDSGKPVGFRGADRDVTERIQAQQALRESEERYRQLFDGASDAVFVTSSVRTVTRVASSQSTTQPARVSAMTEPSCSLCRPETSTYPGRLPRSPRSWPATRRASMQHSSESTSRATAGGSPSRSTVVPSVSRAVPQSSRTCAT